MAISAELLEAYRQAEYVVFCEPEIVLRIGSPSVALDELLDAEGAAGAALVSPGNRRGRRQTKSENAAAFLEMNTLLARTTYRRYPAEGRDPRGNGPGAWGAEASLLIVGMPRADAEALGRALEQ